MAKLTPDATRTEHGLVINEKIIPWGAVWPKDSGAYKKGAQYKADRLLSGGTGKGYGSKIIALLGQIMAFEVPQTSAPSEPEEQEPEFPAYQLEGLETLTEAGVINSPEFWRQKFSEQVTVGEMFGILGKLFTKVTE